MRYLVLLALGLGVGYGLGFQDAKQNDKNIVSRLVEMVGGSTRDKMVNDVDGQMDKVETDSLGHKR